MYNVYAYMLRFAGKIHILMKVYLIVNMHMHGRMTFIKITYIKTFSISINGMWVVLPKDHGGLWWGIVIWLENRTN